MGFITIASGPPARGVAKPQAGLAMAWAWKQTSLLIVETVCVTLFGTIVCVWLGALTYSSTLLPPAMGAFYTRTAVQSGQTRGDEKEWV
jgi:hypothetical protein